MLDERPLDDYREKACRLVIRKSGADKASMNSIPGCVRVKSKSDGFALTFTVDKEQAVERVQAVLGEEPDVEPQSIGLEDLFIDWTGGKNEPAF